MKRYLKSLLQNPIQTVHKSKLLKFGFFICLCSGPLFARAEFKDYRLGALIGFGGTGLQTVSELDSGYVSVSRSEGPLMLTLFSDWLIADNKTLALEHTRGMRMGPFSSGVSFTNLSWRWFFMGPAPSGLPSLKNESTLLVKRYSPYLGYGFGVAFADIARENDMVQSVHGSGMFYNFKIGYDIQDELGKGTRVEISTSSTFQSASKPAVILTAFGIMYGWYKNF